MSDSQLICFCMSVTPEEILVAMENGHITLGALKKELSCCTGCGTCEPRVKKIITEKIAELESKKSSI